MTHANQTTYIWRLLTVLILGILFSYKLYGTIDDDFFLDGLILFFIAIIGIPFFLWTIKKDRQEYKQTRLLKMYLPTITGSVFIFLNAAQFYYQDSKKNGPTLISGFYDGGFNGFSVDFKTDGTYVMANGSGLGESYFYGKYALKDTIITLDKSTIDNCIKTNKLVIKQGQNDPSMKGYIIQIDSNGRELNGELQFRITEDNRN